MPEIKDFSKLHVASVEERGAYGEAMQRGFTRLFAWLHANQIQPQGPSLIILYDDPAKVAPENLRSEQCAPVAAEVEGSGEVRTKDIGGQQVAAIRHRGSENQDRTFDELYDWVHAQGYRDVGVPIEIFHSQPGEEYLSEIVVPIERVQGEALHEAPAEIAVLVEPLRETLLPAPPALALLEEPAPEPLLEAPAEKKGTAKKGTTKKGAPKKDATRKGTAKKTTKRPAKK